MNFKTSFLRLEISRDYFGGNLWRSDSFGSGPGFVSRITSGPGFVNPVRSDPIRSDPGFVSAPFASFRIEHSAKEKVSSQKPLGIMAYRW